MRRRGGACAPAGARRPALAVAAVLGLACAAPPEVPWTSVAVRGHAEARRLGDGRLLPLFASTQDPAGLCLRARAEADTSQWGARLWWRGTRSGERPDGFAEPAVRMADAVCFEHPLSVAAGAEGRLCGEVRDAFDGSTWAVPCQDVGVLPGDSPHADLERRLDETLRDPPAALGSLVGALDRLAAEARRARLPLLEVRIRLIASYFLRTRGGEAGLEGARERVAGLRRWGDQPAASSWMAQVEQELHELELASPSPSWAEMWRHLQRAAALYLETADPKRFTATMQQANLLGQVGATGRAIETLRTALEECREAPCNDRLLDAAWGNLAWLLIVDPLAGDEALTEAESILDRLLGAPSPGEGRLATANRRLNRAYARARRGEDPGSDLAGARRSLAGDGSALAVLLARWADLLEGDAALAGDPAAARAGCRRALEGAASARLAAWATGCVAESYRLTGELEAAATAYRQALELHERASPGALDQSFALDVGRRADDYFRAARVAVERGRPDEAWRILERLDRLGAAGPGAPCRAEEAGEARARRRVLAERLEELDAPASLARERQAEPVKRLLREELAELLRRGDCGGPPAGAAAHRPPGRRAVPLAGEVLLLERSPAGEVSLARRTPIARRAVTEIVRTTVRLAEGGEIDDERWRALVEPVARALVPGPPAAASDGYRLHGYWLHGPLQGIPLAALPVPGAEAGEARWLVDLAAPVLYPADLRAGEGGRERGAMTFVVDPGGNLPSGRRLARDYRSLFPRARILRGPEASSERLREALGASRWLHVDAHGAYDPAFPELSHLEAADGRIGLADLAGGSGPSLGANLLGCWTGAWPITSDGGRWGLAGALVRRGAPWAIGSRTAVDDEVAEDFNRVFYRELARGASVPESYAAAIRGLGRRWPAHRWAGILLIGGPGVASSEGKVAAGRLLTEGGHAP